MNTLKHLPKPGYVGGLKGPARCGRWAEYATRDYALIEQHGREALATGQTEGYCRKCLDRLTVARKR